MAESFLGQHVVVTGASRGIGRAIAEGFSGAGAVVTIMADGEETHDAAVEIAAATGNRVDPVRCDITDRTAVAAAFSRIADPDVLVNNAGFEQLTPILEPGYEVESVFRRVIEINVLGTYYVTREAVRRMRRGARIVLTASVWGKTGEGGFTAYSASKHANIGFMRALARELGTAGIAVNAVCPGWVRTETSMRSLRDESRLLGVSEDEHMRTMLGRQSFGGLMEPKDMVAAYLFLASKEVCGNITGQTLHVDRGEFMD